VAPTQQAAMKNKIQTYIPTKAVQEFIGPTDLGIRI
jgi:hypothetical protein